MSDDRFNRARQRKGMISTATTFVIGAGASCAYGYPTATELHAKALALRPANDDYQLLIEHGRDRAFSVEQLNAVLDDLRLHPADSIDAYLESRQQDATTMKIGRALISTLMGRAIAQSFRHNQIDRNQDWLRYVIDRMRQGAPKWADFAKGNAQVKFVTFNFDRVVEGRLLKDLKAIYPDVEDQAIGETIKIVHVHGVLPPLPTTPLRPHPMSGYSADWIHWVAEASAAVRVVHDDIEQDTLRLAQQTIGGASVLCFLGFAYAQENLKRLGIPQVFQTIEWASRGRNIYGSAYGLRTGERQIVRNRCKNAINLGDINHTCIDVLRDFPVCQD